MTVLITIRFLILALKWVTISNLDITIILVGMGCHNGSMEEHSKTKNKLRLSNQIPLKVVLLIQVLDLVLLIVDLVGQVVHLHLHPVTLMLVHLQDLQVLEHPPASSTNL